jgi:hypothetical protein
VSIIAVVVLFKRDVASFVGGIATVTVTVTVTVMMTMENRVSSL